VALGMKKWVDEIIWIRVISTPSRKEHRKVTALHPVIVVADAHILDVHLDSKTGEILLEKIHDPSHD